MKFYLIVFISIITLVGCGVNNEVSEREPNTLNVKNSTIEHVDKQSGQEISRHLVDLATSLPKVNDATAVVLGRFAIVGIDVDKDMERTQVGSIKYSVAESLKQDPHGAQAIVVADPDINARLKELSKDIQNGAPIQGILNELTEITGRIMPEIPADIVDDVHEKNATEDAKKQLDSDEKQNLENKQEEQSNHQK